jgi:formamidopyrimidine-DNA glycosylase
MPELPELEVVRDILERRLSGRSIHKVTVAPRGGPLVIRDLTHAGFAAGLTGRRISSVSRRGKFIQFALDDGALFLVINPKLSGRMQLCDPSEKKVGPTHVVLGFETPLQELRYIDSKRMGQLYLTDQVNSVPTFDQMGPEALEIDRDAFGTRIKRYRGEIKGVITRAAFVAGIGNAYGDEILWAARLNPFRKRPSLDDNEINALYDAMRSTLTESIERVRQAMGEDIHLKPRDFFAVHLRGGEACPRCGSAISSVTAHQKITNFCRTCQPGGLIRGMTAPRLPKDES